MAETKADAETALDVFGRPKGWLSKLEKASAPPALAGGARETLRRHIETAISHARPSARQSNCTQPFIPSRIMLSITPMPNPLRVGGLTGGPPASVQRSTRSPCSARDQPTRTWPSATDRAPYFAALVANSCTATAMAWATSGFNMMVGPSIWVRLSPARP